MEDKKPGWTKIENDIWVALRRVNLSKAQSRCLYRIIELTICFHQTEFVLDRKKFAREVGIGNNNLDRELRVLSTHNIINILKNEDKTNQTIRINTKYKTWGYPQNRGQSSSEMRINVLRNEDTPIKRKLEKKTIKERVEKTLIPDNFILTNDLKTYAIKKGVIPEKVDQYFEYFKTKAKAKGWKNYDWGERFKEFVIDDKNKNWNSEYFIRQSRWDNIDN